MARRGVRSTWRTLPSAGRLDPAPPCPIALGAAGAAGGAGVEWWTWAWATPASTEWGAGSIYGVAHRALLEDLILSVERSGAYLTEARDVDDSLGLTPRGMVLLRWMIEQHEPPYLAAVPPVTPIHHRMRVTDPQQAMAPSKAPGSSDSSAAFAHATAHSRS
jgi:hypothetical protein